jgi:hypothetical protein
LRTNGYHALPPPRTGRRRQQQVKPLEICYQNAWKVLQKYNDLTDKSHEIYAAATLLNPCLRLRYFQSSWTDNAAAMIQPMIERNRGIWETLYRQNTTPPVSQVPRSNLSTFMRDLVASDNTQNDDEFDQYINGPRLVLKDWKAQHLFQWWSTCPYTSLRQWAFDTLSIPAMSAELERVFSQAKRLYTVDRNRLSATTFEASLCLKQWHDQGLYNIPLGPEQQSASQ